MVGELPNVFHLVKCGNAEMKGSELPHFSFDTFFFSPNYGHGKKIKSLLAFQKPKMG